MLTVGQWIVLGLGGALSLLMIAGGFWPGAAVIVVPLFALGAFLYRRQGRDRRSNSDATGR